jgi:hypothetical protein
MSRNIEKKNIAEVGPKEEERNEEAKVDQIASELGIDLVTLAKSDEKEFAKAYEEVFKEYVERLKTEPLKAQKAAVRWWVKEGDGFNVMILLGRFGFPGKEDIKTMAGGVIESLDLGWSDRYEDQLVNQAFRNNEKRIDRALDRAFRERTGLDSSRWTRILNL